MQLPAICALAFIVVFVLLAILAVAMHLITRAFPERKPSVDPALVAAITGAVAVALPGARVTRIEEKA